MANENDFNNINKIIIMNYTFFVISSVKNAVGRRVFWVFNLPPCLFYSH